ncbi:MAG: error-prone DNA polymerase [Saccharospirillum sp.]
MSSPELDFAELYCLTNYSFLQGASHPDELVLRAAELGYRALAITDEASVAGVVKAWRTLRTEQLDLKLIIGAHFHYQSDTLVLLAPDQAAYQQLCQLITRTRRRCTKGRYQLLTTDLQQAGHCFCLWQPGNLSNAQTRLRQFRACFPGGFWVLVNNLLTDQSQQRMQQTLALAEKESVPAVCGNEVLMHSPKRKDLQDALTAIRYNQTLEQTLPQLKPNAENHLRSRNKLRSLYPDALLAETLAIAERCTFSLSSLSSLSYRYPKDVLPGQYSAEAYLRLLVRQGAKRRFPQGTTPKIEADIEKELRLIREKDYEHYFLTVYDIVRHARSRGILCQGRGSAANSVVCYCLGITEVNPLEASLLFERFISTGRSDPPDIDVDFEHERREEVIQYIYQKYGRKRAALAATVIIYRAKSALRDLGKAMDLDLNQLEQRIANYGWRYRSRDWVNEIIDEGIGLSQQRLGLFKQLLTELQGFPRHLSQHVGGFVITEGVVADLVPVENAAMADRTVIQWDKDDLEAVGLMKVDILALGMLSAVRKTFDSIRDHHHQSLRIQDIRRDDPNVFRMIQQADTVGVFQIESRAQMNMLPRLKPTCYYDLVVQVAIVRPGPIHGDMVHPYLKRRTGKESVDYPNPALKPILERTLGVPIFQEQVIALAMTAADFNADEANELRKSMASWKKTGHISLLRDKLTTNMKHNGYPETFISRINRQIEGFGEYGFPESHAAGFALIAYISSWLKYHYPAAFCCALLNSLPMGFYSASQLVQDVKRHGVEVLPIDINLSDWDSHLVQHNGSSAIRLGLRRVKGLSKEAAQSLLQNRPCSGYTRIAALEHLPDLTRKDLDALASANALQSISGNRFQARWQTTALRHQNSLLSEAFDTHQIPMALPEPDALHNLREDHRSQGLTLGPHLIELLRQAKALPNTCSANQLLGLAKTEQSRLQRLSHTHGLMQPDRVRIPIQVLGVVVNRQRPKTSAGVTFVTLEDETGNINVIVWLQTAQTYMRVLTTEPLILVTGLLEKAMDNDVVHVIAERIEGLSDLAEGVELTSRDFH